MAAILSFYSDQLPLLEKSSLQQVCLTCSQLASQGFPWYQIPATDEEYVCWYFFLLLCSTVHVVTFHSCNDLMSPVIAFCELHRSCSLKFM